MEKLKFEQHWLQRNREDYSPEHNRKVYRGPSTMLTLEVRIGEAVNILLNKN